MSANQTVNSDKSHHSGVSCLKSSCHYHHSKTSQFAEGSQCNALRLEPRNLSPEDKALFTKWTSTLSHSHLLLTSGTIIILSCCRVYKKSSSATMGHKVVLAVCSLNQWAMDFEGNLKRIIESRWALFLSFSLSVLPTMFSKTELFIFFLKVCARLLN